MLPGLPLFAVETLSITSTLRRRGQSLSSMTVIEGLENKTFSQLECSDRRSPQKVLDQDIHVGPSINMINRKFRTPFNLFDQESHCKSLRSKSSIKIFYLGPSINMINRKFRIPFDLFDQAC